MFRLRWPPLRPTINVSPGTLNCFSVGSFNSSAFSRYFLIALKYIDQYDASHISIMLWALAAMNFTGTDLSPKIFTVSSQKINEEESFIHNFLKNNKKIHLSAIRS